MPIKDRESLGARPAPSMDTYGGYYGGDGGIGRAVSSVSKGLGDVATAASSIEMKEQADRDAFDLTRANTMLNAETIKLQRDLGEEQDYSKIRQLNTEGYKKAVSSAGGLFRNKENRTKWLAGIADNAEQQNTFAYNLSRKKEGDFVNFTIDNDAKYISQYLRFADAGQAAQMYVDLGKNIDNAVEAGFKTNVEAGKLRYTLSQEYANDYVSKMPDAEIVEKFNRGKKRVSQYSTDYASPSYLATVAMLESSGGKNTVNPLNPNAVGMYQFTESTADSVGLINRDSNLQSVKGAAKLAKKISVSLQKRTGKKPDDWQIYFGHQQGIAGAGRLLSRPKDNVLDVLMPSYKTKGRTEDEARRVATKAIENNGGNIKMSANEFSKIWKDKYNKAQTNDLEFDGYEATGTPADWLEVSIQDKYFSAASKRLEGNEATNIVNRLSDDNIPLKDAKRAIAASKFTASKEAAIIQKLEVVYSKVDEAKRQNNDELIDAAFRGNSEAYEMLSDADKVHYNAHKKNAEPDGATLGKIRSAYADNTKSILDFSKAEVMRAGENWVKIRDDIANGRDINPNEKLKTKAFKVLTSGKEKGYVANVGLHLEMVEGSFEKDNGRRMNVAEYTDAYKKALIETDVEYGYLWNTEMSPYKMQPDTLIEYDVIPEEYRLEQLRRYKSIHGIRMPNDLLRHLYTKSVRGY